jgi:hypothetical protein
VFCSTAKIAAAVSNTSNVPVVAAQLFPAVFSPLLLVLLQYRNSDPTVAAEYQSYAAAEGRLTSLIKGEHIC